MIKQQLRYNVLCKKFMWILIFGILILLFSALNEVFPAIIAGADLRAEELNRYSLWCDSLKSYLIAIPILATLPSALTYRDETRYGIIKFINLRVDNRKYIRSKIISNCITGGLAVVIPVVIITLIIFIFFRGNIADSYMYKAFGGAYNSLFQSYFSLYVLLHLTIYFFHGAAYASIALAVSSKIQNTIAILLSPIIYFMLGSVMFELLHIRYLSPGRVFQFYFNPYVLILEIVISVSIIFIISSSVFMYFTKKEFIYEGAVSENASH